MDIEKLPYAAWLEDLIKTLIAVNPYTMCVVARTESGDTLTGYYYAEAEDKAVMAHAIQSDIVMDLIENNISTIKEMLEDETE